MRRQLTLGFVSFAKLAIWADLNVDKWPELLEHTLLKRVLSGGCSNGEGLFHAEDYVIDEHPQADLPLIYDADSSQHSAIIDVLAGKDVVINGPPGTGKSQTITNVIAAALRAGKTVLFVSEKLAALEVVRQRLEMAHLGDFCLELHSHKSQKKKLMKELEARINARFPAQLQVKEKLGVLHKQKRQLNRYAELMGSELGNCLAATVHQVFWTAERRRQELGDLAERMASSAFVEAPEWTLSDLEERRALVASLAQLHNEIGAFNQGHPWWGFRPRILSPGDDIEVRRIIEEGLGIADRLVGLSRNYVQLVDSSEAPSLQMFQSLAQGTPRDD